MPELSNMQGRTIAWIEDDIDVIDPVVKPLRQVGFQILEFRTYSEAVAHLEELSSCDLILLDLILPPGMEEVSDSKYLGLELLKYLRKANIKAPVVIFSVVAEIIDITREELQELNATTVSKPVRPLQLKSHIFERLGLTS
jgi:CheY-like chemotaxis protein